MHFNAPARVTVIVSVVLAIVSLVVEFGGISILGIGSYVWAGLAWLVLALGSVLKGM